MNTEVTDKPAAKDKSRDERALQAEIDGLAEQIDVLSRDLARLGESSLRTARRGAARGVEAFSRASDKLGDSVGRELARGEDRVMAEVHDHPLRALAIAVGAGALLALFLRR